IRDPATVIASTMMMLISAPLQSQRGWRAAAVNSPKLPRATSISAIASSAARDVAQASAPKTPTRSPSFDITATWTEPAIPAITAKRTTSTFTAGQHRRALGHEEGRRGPALSRVIAGSCYPVVTFVPSTVGFCPNTCTSVTWTSVFLGGKPTAVGACVARQSELMFGSLSWSPWYDVCPVHWLFVTTNLMCVATWLL